MSTPEERLGVLETKVAEIDTVVAGLRTIEPILQVFVENIDFFKALVSSLDSRLRAIEVTSFDGTPARLKNLEAAINLLDRPTLVAEVTASARSTLHEDVTNLQRTIDDFRRDTTALYATKAELDTARPTSTSTTKGKMALPEVFSGKREDWKVFASHLTLYFTAHKDAYPLDSDKITFAVSRLGNGSAFKYMSEFIPKLEGPVALRPPIVTNFDLFMKTMKETFGVQNANVVSETQLLQLRQKGSAVDYTNKFLELSSDLSGWTDAPLITHYRRGLKPEVIKAIDGLQVIPTTFSTFTEKAIEIDSRQFATFLELQNRLPASNPTRSSTMNRTVTPVSRPAGASTVTSTAPPSMAMDLSTARHLSPEEKKRRLDNNLCLYCGEPGHRIAQCTANKKSLASAEIVESSSSSDDVSFSLEKE
jgi:hypothetical protein